LTKSITTPWARPESVGPHRQISDAPNGAVPVLASADGLQPRGRTMISVEMKGRKVRQMFDFSKTAVPLKMVRIADGW
jgi:hypothetical protein